MADDNTMVYAARYKGSPGFGGIVVDEFEHRDETARTVAAWIRNGAIVERVTVATARVGMQQFLMHRAANPAPKQGGLFDG